MSTKSFCVVTLKGGLPTCEDDLRPGLSDSIVFNAAPQKTTTTTFRREFNGKFVDDINGRWRHDLGETTVLAKIFKR